LLLKKLYPSVSSQQRGGVSSDRNHREDARGPHACAARSLSDDPWSQEISSSFSFSIVMKIKLILTAWHVNIKYLSKIVTVVFSEYF